MKRLGFGFMRLPILEEGNFQSIDLEQVKEMVDIFMDNGFNYFDTAYPYHKEKSEEALRKALVKRYPRDSFLIADKMPTIRVKSGADYPVFFETQLKRCGVEYFDYYLFHNIWKKSFAETEEYGGFEFINKKMEEGRIKHFGFSFHDEPELLDKVLSGHPEVEFVQLQINYFDWKSPSVRAEECYNIAAKHNKDIFVMEPNKGGSLVNLPSEGEKLFKSYSPDASNASWAMRYAASLDNVKIVLSGMSNINQLKDNISFMDKFIPLNNTEKNIIEEVRKIIEKNTAIGCTKCRYCTENCPLGIPIPEYFSAFNTYQLTHNMGNAGMYYRRYANGRRLASECIKCGKCENNCPQHLKIRELLEETANLFEIKQ